MYKCTSPFYFGTRKKWSKEEFINNFFLAPRIGARKNLYIILSLRQNGTRKDLVFKFLLAPSPYSAISPCAKMEQGNNLFPCAKLFNNNSVNCFEWNEEGNCP